MTGSRVFSGIIGALLDLSPQEIAWITGALQDDPRSPAWRRPELCEG
ncbi:hypothetical protein [uncultured Aeromicrobium sp.]|nr:hypothetical protein [uncultured Aeromicrobium sp.]